MCFQSNRAQPPYKKEDKKSDKLSEKDKDLSKKQEAKSGKSDSVSSNSGPDSLKKDDRKHGRMLYSSFHHRFLRIGLIIQHGLC